MEASRSPAIGSHVAVAGGLIKTGLGEAVEIGAEVIQLFAGNPRSWSATALDPLAAEAFRAACGELGLAVYVHAPHIVNLGSPDPATVERSTIALGDVLERAAALGATAVVVHAGSAVRDELRATALGRLHGLLGAILDTAPPPVRLLIEPTSGAGAALASTVETTTAYLAAVDDERVGLCLDLCHLHAAGEPVGDPGGLTDTLTRIVDEVGRGRLGLIHVNDSRDARGSHRDRHAALGQGEIGPAGLPALFSTPAIAGVPLLVETPDHAADVALLKHLRSHT